MSLYSIKCSNFTENKNIEKKNIKQMEKLIFILAVLSAILRNLKLLIKKN